MKVHDKTGLKIFLILLGFVLIILTVFCFGVIDFSNIEKFLFNQREESENFFTEFVYEIFVLFFIIFALIWPLYLLKISQNIKKVTREFSAKDDSDFEKICKKKKAFLGIWESYKSTFINNTNDEFNDFENRTRVDADLYFNSEEIVKNHFLKLPLISFLKLVSGSFVGLGILGTFIGFSQSLSGGIDIQDQSQLNIIVDGLKIAFNTSIFGIFSSIVYNFLVEYPIIQMLNDSSRWLSDELDKRFYISDEFCTRTLGHVVYETRGFIENSNSEMTKNITEAILEGRESFTVELNKTVSTLKTLSEELYKTPESIRVINEELKSSIDEVKINNKVMLDDAINTVRSSVENTFDSFKERFDNTGKVISDSVSSLSEIPDTLVDMLEKSSKSLQNNFINFLDDNKTQYKQFISDAESNISHIINDTAAKNIKNNKEMLVSTGKSFETISATMEKSFENYVNDSVVNINALIEDGKQQLKDTYGIFAESVIDSVNKNNDIIENLSKIKTEYSELNNSIECSSLEIKNAGKELSDSIKVIFDELPCKMNHLVEELGEAALSINAAIDSLDSIKNIPSSVSVMLNDFAKTANQLDSTYNGTMEKITTLYNFCNKKEKESADVLKKYVEKIDDNSITNISSEESYKKLTKTIKDNFDGLRKWLASFAIFENKNVSEGKKS